MERKTVVIDPGHGGRDAGFVYQPLIKPAACYKEKNIVMSVSCHLAGYFSGYHGDEVSYKTCLTRSGDRHVGLWGRVIFANLVGADAVISCHVNDVPNSVDPNTRQGVSVLYLRGSDQSFDMGDSVLDELLKTGLLKPSGDGLMPSGIDILRRMKAPAIVVQLGYIRNYTDLAVITDEDCQAKLAYGIFKGIHQWLVSHEEVAELIRKVHE